MNSKFGEALFTLKNSKLQEIPQFADKIISLAKDEIAKKTNEVKQLKKEQKNLSEQQKKFYNGKMAILFDQIYRIKRFLLIYYNYRTDKIEDQFWYYGGDIKTSQQKHLCEKEKMYFVQYKNLVMNYIEGVGLDITSNIDPVEQNQISVRLTKDCGQIMDENGQIRKLSKNTAVSLDLKLAENLIKQGSAIIR